MLLAALFLAAAAPPPLTEDVEISPAVVEIVRTHGRQMTPDAVKQLEALGAAGDRTAYALLGELSMLADRSGSGDSKRGCDYSEQAGRHASALHNLATCYFVGNGRTKDLARSRALYGQAADMGFAKAACAFGNMLIAGLGGEADVPRGLDLCRRAADAGVPDAQTDYGGYLLIGRHVPKDAVLARRYLTLAAEKRHANASFLLGQIYWKGDGVGTDRAEAARWWRVSHDAGRPDAAYMIALEGLTRILEARQAKSQIETRILRETEQWLKIAAEKDSDPARRSRAVEMLRELAAMQRRD